jgi:hypothetical protein
MNDLRAAAQQALEALENCTSEHGHRCNRCDSEVDEGGRVITALRAALAQQAPHPDTIRLAYLYGGEKTASDALMNAQLRLFLGGALTLDEARAAIDDAIANPMMEDDHD